ncbi:hypothetical protein [Nocardia jiangxiensis]|uniref:hypothetical protein n=1 Tax=Nocardia jiangxiensis TaxID=282685 RepID=UPI000594640B|nr:hypothetical protein [Nocardia jiangxiensis]
MYGVHFLKANPFSSEAYCALISTETKLPLNAHPQLIEAYNDPRTAVILQDGDYPTELYILTGLRTQECECGENLLLAPEWSSIS